MSMSPPVVITAVFEVSVMVPEASIVTSPPAPVVSRSTSANVPPCASMVSAWLPVLTTVAVTLPAVAV